MRVVIDTNVYISAFIVKGTCARLLHKLNTNQDKYNIFISNEIYLELEDKLFNSKKILKFLGENYNLDEIKLFLELVKLSTKNHNPKTKITLCRDPKDNMILELAGEICADYIITGDKDLLVLKTFVDENLSGINVYPNKSLETQIVTVSQFLEIIASY